MTAAQPVPPGYKRTEVGVIPDTWEAPSLGEMFTFRNGLNKAKQYFGYGTPIVNYMDVYGYPGLRVRDIQGTVDVSKQELRAFSVRRGDVFFTRTSETVDEIGVASVMLDEPKDTVFSGFVLRARPVNDRLDPGFCQYCFSTSAVRKQITTTSTYTTRALTNGKVLSKVVIPLPPLDEQRAIANALADIDALLTKLDARIEKQRALKTAAMQKLLTGQRRLPGYSREWKTRQIGEFTDCTAGGTPSTAIAEYWGGIIKWMNSGELHLKIVHDVDGRITEAGLRNSSTKLIPPHCVLIGLAGQGRTRGTVAMNLVDLCTNQSIAAIFPNDSFDPTYLYFNLDNRYEELRGLSTGEGGRGGLNLKIIRSIPIPFPPLTEQRAIAAVLSDMDAAIAALEAQRAKTADVKQAMMQDLLTGRIRLR